MSPLGELPKQTLPAALTSPADSAALQCTADGFQLPLCCRAGPQLDSSLRELVPPLFTFMSAYTLAPGQPDKEFLITVIELTPNNLSEHTASPLGPSPGVQTDEMECSGCYWAIASVKKGGLRMWTCAAAVWIFCLLDCLAKSLWSPWIFCQRLKGLNNK